MCKVMEIKKVIAEFNVSANAFDERCRSNEEKCAIPTVFRIHISFFRRYSVGSCIIHSRGITKTYAINIRAWLKTNPRTRFSSEDRSHRKRDRDRERKGFSYPILHCRTVGVACPYPDASRCLYPCLFCLSNGETS